MKFVTRKQAGRAEGADSFAQGALLTLESVALIFAGGNLREKAFDQSRDGSPSFSREDPRSAIGLIVK